MNINELCNIKKKDINMLKEVSNSNNEIIQKVERLIDQIKIIILNDDKIREITFSKIHNDVCTIIRGKKGDFLYKKLEEVLYENLSKIITQIDIFNDKAKYLSSFIEIIQNLYFKAELIKKLLFYYETNYIAKDISKKEFISFTKMVVNRTVCKLGIFDMIKEYIISFIKEYRIEYFNYLVNHGNDETKESSLVFYDKNSKVLLISNLIKFILDIDINIYYNYIESFYITETERYFKNDFESYNFDDFILFFNSNSFSDYFNSSELRGNEIVQKSRFNVFLFFYIIKMEENINIELNLSLSWKKMNNRLYKILIENYLKEKSSNFIEYLNHLNNMQENICNIKFNQKLSNDDLTKHLFIDNQSKSYYSNLISSFISNNKKSKNNILEKQSTMLENSVEIEIKKLKFSFEEVIFLYSLINNSNEDEKSYYVDLLLKLISKSIEKIIGDILGNTDNNHKLQHINPELEKTLRLILFLSVNEILRKKLTTIYDGKHFIFYTNSIKTFLGSYNKANKNELIQNTCIIMENYFNSTTKFSNTEINEFIDQLLNFIKVIEDKDIFELFYRKSLSRRVINPKIFCYEIESLFIVKLKMEYGTVYTQNLEALLQESENSRTIKSKFYISKYSIPALPIQSLDIKHFLNYQINENDLNSSVLSKDYFSTKNYSTNVNNMNHLSESNQIPNFVKNQFLDLILIDLKNWPLHNIEMQNMRTFLRKVSLITSLMQVNYLTNFLNYLTNNYKGKIINVNLFYGTMEVNMIFKKKIYLFTCSAIQGLLLMLFNNLIIYNTFSKNKDSLFKNANKNVDYTNGKVSYKEDNSHELINLIKTYIKDNTTDFSINLLKFLVCNIKLKNNDNNNALKGSEVHMLKKTDKKNSKESKEKEKEFDINLIENSINNVSSNILLSHIIPMVKIGIISYDKDSEIISLNKNFNSKSTRITLSVSHIKSNHNISNPNHSINTKNTNEEEKDIFQISQYRKNIIDSNIVRLMKYKKRCEFNELVKSVVESIKEFTPDLFSLKERLEYLCERLIIKREDTNVNYYIYVS